MTNEEQIHNERIQPAYAESFQCIGPACEDTCCQQWNVPVDRATWDKYQSLPPSELRVLVDANVVRSPESKDSCGDAAAGSCKGHAQPFATIRMNDANECSFLTTERLCRIQSELGADMQPPTCATYPRIVHSVNGVKEQALAFSCPEAVRHVLFTPDLPLRIENPAAPEVESADTNSLQANFWPIRALVVKLVRARAYPLWQRLFLLELLCRRLDAIAAGGINRTVPRFLGDFEIAVDAGTLRAAMDALPADRNAQMDIVLRLSGLLLRKSMVTARFLECVRAFTAGIGNGPAATLENLAEQYALAHNRYYAPFFDRHPHVMENIILNTIFRCHFPFGKDGMSPGAHPNMARESALLVAQFALLRGLLIGVAGFHGVQFSEAHVVHTAQSASKHFEHHPEFLNMAHALLVESQMDGARGLAILLRSAGDAEGAGHALPTPSRIFPANSKTLPNLAEAATPVMQ